MWKPEDGVICKNTLDEHMFGCYTVRKETAGKRRKEEEMPFVNSLLSYLLLFLVSVIVMAAGITLGINLRRKKDQQETASRQEKQQ